MAAEFALALACVRRRHPSLRFSVRGFDRALVRSVLAFSVFAMLLNVGTLLAFRSDALVIGAFLTSRAVTEFDLGNKFFEPLTALVVSVGAVVMPAATRLKAAGDAQALKTVLLKWSKLSLSLVLAVALYLYVLGPQFLAWWTGPEYAGPAGSVLRILLVSFVVYLPVRGVALPILMGLGRPARPALALLAMGAVNVAASLALVRPLGIDGVALGTAIPNVAFALFVLAVACRETGVSIGEYARHVALKPFVGALAPLAALAACRAALDVTSLAGLALSGCAMLAVFAATWVFFVYRGDPHLDLHARAMARWRRAPQEGTP
jgi:O-antigen/teichoic acid export membrane protein